MQDRGGETELVQSQLRQRVFGHVLRGEPHHDRARYKAEDESLAERCVFHRVLVEVWLRGVHHELGEHLVLRLSDGRAAGMLNSVPHAEVLEIVAASCKRSSRASAHPARPTSRSEMILRWVSEGPSKIVVNPAARPPPPPGRPASPARQRAQWCSHYRHGSGSPRSSRAQPSRLRTASPSPPRSRSDRQRRSDALPGTSAPALPRPESPCPPA